MKKQIYTMTALLLAAALLLAGCTAQPGGEEQTVTDPPKTAVSQTVARPEGYEPAAVLEYLCSTAFSGRQTGTDGCVEAGEYVAGFLTEWGYRPLFGDSLAVPYTAVVGDPALAEPELTLHLPGEDVTLEPGVDYTYNFHGEDLAVTLPVSPRAEDCARGQAAHLVAVGTSRDDSPIVLRERKNLDASSDVREEWIIELSPEAFAKARQAERVTIHLKASAREMERDNYCAVLPGADRAHAMVLCAHFDGTGTWGDTLYPSAHDNASGTVALLECARLLAEESLPFDLVLCAFSGEEQHLLGSAALAPRLEEHYELVNVINLDCLGCGVPDSLKILGKSTALGEALWPYLQQAGYTDYENYNAASDQDSFTHPAIGLCELPEDYRFHRADDRVDTVDPAWLVDIAAAVCDYVKQAEIKQWGAAQVQTAPSGDVFAGVMNEYQREARRLELTEGLAYDQGIGGNLDYVMSGEAGSYRETKSVLYTAWGMLKSTEEVLQYYPDLELPETIGDASFFGAYVVHGRAFDQNRILLRPEGYWEEGKQYTVDWSNYSAVELYLYYCREDGSGWRLYTDGGSFDTAGVHFLSTGERSHGFHCVLEDGRQLEVMTFSELLELEGIQATGIYWHPNVQLNDKTTLQELADLIQPEAQAILDWVTAHQK